MRSQFLKVSSLALASELYIPLTLGQEAEAEVEAPPPPTPQEVAAENLDQLLELVERAQSRASSEIKARVLSFASD